MEDSLVVFVPFEGDFHTSRKSLAWHRSLYVSRQYTDSLILVKNEQLKIVFGRSDSHVVFYVALFVATFPDILPRKNQSANLTVHSNSKNFI